MGAQGSCLGLGYRSKSSTNPKDRIFALKFSRSRYLDNPCQKAFILAPKILCMVSLYSMTSDLRDLLRGGAI